jgi:uncharacterized protein YegP (UPF0339 family)
MAGKFEIIKDKAGKFRFRLWAGNGEIIAVSEAYESKASAKNGIESVRRTRRARRWSICRKRPRRSRRL